MLHLKLDETQKERNATHQKLLESEKTILNVKIDLERRQLRVTQLGNCLFKCNITFITLI